MAKRVHERTLVIIKPDGVQRGLLGNILHRFERKGLKIVGMKMLAFRDDTTDEHYSHLVDKPFYPGIKNFMQSSPVVALVLEGYEVVDVIYNYIVGGATNSRVAPPGSIRGDYGISRQSNLIHASDSIENAKTEIQRFFKKEELFDYDKTEFEHIYAQDEKEGEME